MSGSIDKEDLFDYDICCQLVKTHEPNGGNQCPHQKPKTLKIFT